MSLLIRPQTRQNSAAVTSAVPGRSSERVVWSRDSSTPSSVTPIASTPIGTLIQNTADQSAFSTSSPPSRGPIASPRPEIPAHTPIAAGSRFGGNVATRIESDSGFISAAPVPWIARAATSIPDVVDSAQPADAAVKIARPTMNSRRRPKRSPSLPPSRISAANGTTYAFTVQASVSGLTWSSRWIDGSATFTIVLSSMIMNRPKHIANNVTRSRRAVLHPRSVRPVVMFPSGACPTSRGGRIRVQPQSDAVVRHASP